MSSDSRNSVANPIRILEVVARLGTGTTAKEVIESLQIAPATAYRILNSLVGDEYLVRSSNLRGFALGPAVGGLISAATPPAVCSAALDAMNEFREGKRFAVHLMMFRNASLRVACEDPDYPINSTFEMQRYPHASAPGRLMLAELTGSTVKWPKGPLEKVTPETVTDRGRLVKLLEDIRTRGESTDIGELETGSARLALPVRRPNGAAGAAICLACPADRFETVREHVDATRTLVAQLAPLLF